MTVYLDACFSGDSPEGMLVKSASPVYVTAELPAEAGEKLTVLTAASGGQLASWDEEAGHGLFTNHLLDALYGKADADGNREVTAGEVQEYLLEHMTYAARRQYRRRQEATLNGLPDVVLVSAVAGLFPVRPGAGEAADEQPAPTTEQPPTGGSLDEAAVERDVVLLGISKASEAGEHTEVLRYVERLKDLGGELTLEARYFQGQAYAGVGKNEEANQVLKAYLQATGRGGPHYEDVLELLLEVDRRLSADDDAYEQAKATGTVAAYGEYLRAYPSGRHAVEAGERQAEEQDNEAYKRAKSLGTSAAYRAYLRDYPEGRHVAEARVLQAETLDDEEYERAKRLGTSAAYGDYLVVYPNGRHASEARRRQSAARDDEAYERAESEGTAAAYGAYLRSYPSGRHAAEARRLKAEAERAERLVPGAKFRDCDECPEMVVVPAGSYRMGSPPSEAGRFVGEGPVHRVTFQQPFAVGVYEVTFAEWDECAAAGACGGYRPSDDGWGRGKRPVIHVNWTDAQAYVRWLSEKTGEEYRLLSESEWEYMARAGTTTPFHTGETISTKHANYNGNFVYGSGIRGEYRQETLPVGQFPSNAFGLHDVHGNVWEWTQDCWNASYAGAPADGRAWERGVCGRRMRRGGSWKFAPKGLRSAFRSGDDNTLRFNEVGFRVARTIRL